MTCSACERVGLSMVSCPSTNVAGKKLKRTELPPGPLYIKLENGTLKEVLAEYDEEDESGPEFSASGLIVTASGRNHVASLLSEASDDLAILGLRIQRLLEGSLTLQCGRHAWGSSTVSSLG